MARAGLNRGRVVAQAAVLADDIGLERITLASVAKHLGVRLPSLYNHVEGLEGLRRELSMLALRELAGQLGAAAVGKAGKDALRATADAYRAYALRFPGRYAATVTAPAPADDDHNEAAAAVLQVVVSVLHGYGLAGDPVIHAVRELRASLHGWADLEKRGAFGMPHDVDVSYQRLIDHLHVSLTQYADEPAPQ